VLDAALAELTQHRIDTYQQQDKNEDALVLAVEELVNDSQLRWTHHSACKAERSLHRALIAHTHPTASSGPGADQGGCGVLSLAPAR